MAIRSFILSLALLATGCATTSLPTQEATLGTARPSAELLPLIDQPGPIEVESIVSADWEINRGGLINLGHPTAVAAGLEDGPEPIQIFFHAIRHPEFGTFIIDSGIERAFRDQPEQAALRGLAASASNADALVVRQPLGDWLAAQSTPLSGVFLTHLHLDHVLGLPDVPKGTKVFVGPGDAQSRSAMNLFVRGVFNEALRNVEALDEWSFDAAAPGPFAGAVDVFGDASFWALSAPGHTPGSTAYLARTTQGPVLFVGDASHTEWGWEHDVEPGTFSADRPRSVESLKALRKLVADHPAIRVRLGHQHHPATADLKARPDRAEGASDLGDASADPGTAP
ncbi:MAG: MBL fold metallo-hydrolase [Myxococcaceae bacterium]